MVGRSATGEVNLQIVLLVSDDSAPCRSAERLWSALGTELGFKLQVVAIEQPEGSRLAHRLEVKSVPALVIDDKAISVGVPTIDDARVLLANWFPTGS